MIYDKLVGSYKEILEAAFGASALAMIGTLLVIFIIVALAVYVYTAWAWMTIGNKLKYKKSWLAWIPIANIAMILQLGGFHWAWVFLVVVPIAGWIALAVLTIIATWHIYEKRDYPGWLSLIQIGNFIPFVSWIAGIANLVILGLVAWLDR